MDSRESLHIQTDRDIYVVGEQVWMKVFKMDAHENRPDNLSKVVYVELLNQAGNPVNQKKILVPHKSGSTVISLSDTLSSGNYIFRAYTGWMKNFPANDFSFRTISVINPFRSVEGIGVKRSLPAAENKDTLMLPTDKGLFLELRFEKAMYGTREKVKVDVQTNDASGNPVEADLSVSVARSSMYNSQRKSFPDLVYPLGRDQQESTPFLPELEGTVVSGTMFDRISGEPITNENILMSIVGKAAKCQVYRTNDKGKFYFNLDDQGVQELVIQAVDSNMIDYYIDLEPDFHSSYDHRLPGHLSLDTVKLQALNQAIINMQIENIYKPYRQNSPAANASAPDVSFYGKPEYQIELSDYIRLNNIREVINEIVPSVSVRIKNGRSSLRMENGINNQVFDNKPLVLVDGVPFDDIDQIFNIPLAELEGIEVINLRYFLDGHLFEGIIHFITREGRMAGLEFGQTVFRQAYTSLSEPSRFRSPIYNNDSLIESPVPDFRNTLYWDPDLNTGENGLTTFEFYTSDETGDFVVFLEGISPEGKTGFVTEKLSVR